MAITLRLSKGSELTFAEVDDNFKSVFYSSSFDGNELKLFYYPGTISQSIDLSVLSTGSFSGSFSGVISGSTSISGDLTVTGSITYGDVNAPSLNDTSKITATGNGNIVYSLPTSSYTGAFIHYTAQSGTNARAGSIISTWIPGTSDIVFTETSTTDIGSTEDVKFTTLLSGSDMVVTASAGAGSWTIKSIIESI